MLRSPSDGYAYHDIFYFTRKKRTRIPAVDTAPVREMMRVENFGTSTHEQRQKKMYGMSVVITEMLASSLK
jgi:hypothetical protein